MAEPLEQIGPFRLVRRLGVGGMAEAFEAVRASPGGLVQRVCVKRVLPAHAHDPDFVRMFRREAEMAASLHHTGIVGVLDVGESEGLPYLALELVDGVDLRGLLATTTTKRLPAHLVAHLATELADALAYAHRGDATAHRPALVHRDVSPSNVLVGRSGEIKLADFGLAKAVDAHSVTRSGAMRGKIPYMAPEHMRGNDVDGRMDLFSLGVVLFEALAGRRPFDGAHDVETMTRILADQRPELLDLRPDVPPYLAAIVERLLAADPRNRFPSADALLEALAEAGPLDHARLALGDLVEARLGGVATRAHVAMNSERDRVNAHWLSVVPKEEPRSLAPGHERIVERASAGADPASQRTAEGGNGPHTEALTRRVLVSAPTPARRRGGMLAIAAAAACLVGVGAAAMAARAPSPSAGRGERPAEAGANADGVAPLPTARPSSAAGTIASRPPAAPSRGVPEPQLAAPPAEARPQAPETEPPPGPTTREPARPVGRPASVRVFVHPWGSVWVDHRFVGRAPRVVELAPGPHLVEGGHDRPIAGRRIVVQAGERRSLDLELQPDP